MLLFQIQPIPRDIPLPLPLPEWILISLLIISFLAHILFINLMLGGSVLTVIFQIMGLKKEKYDKLAYEIANTITVNKSLAVVLGVAPLLVINALYTIYFYSANALTANLWISIIPLLIIAFLVTYYHKYNWEKYKGNKRTHIAIGLVATLIFLFIPLIFLTNINLMIFPERWAEVRGAFSAMIFWNVIPRYLHFLAGTTAITGLFIVGYFGRKSFPFEERLSDFSREEIKRLGYKLTFYVTISQIVFGPFVLFTLPWGSVSWHLIGVVTTAALIASAAVYFLWKEIRPANISPGKYFITIVLLLSLTVLLMGWGRHVYRSDTLAPHQELMKVKTEAYYNLND
ncbi:MAG: cytochrome C [Bacteroidetes bacterium]|nr:cytochrome C [Bacteroidota bacterium]